MNHLSGPAVPWNSRASNNTDAMSNLVKRSTIMNAGAGIACVIAAFLAYNGVAHGALIATVISGALWAVASLIQFFNAEGRGIRVRISLLPVVPFAWVVGIYSL